MRRFPVLAACFLTVFIAYAVRYGYGVLLPEMLPTLGVSKAAAGVVYSSFFIAYTVCSPVLGLLADRLNTRVLISGFVALLGLGALLMAFAASVLTASIFFALAGIGAAACWAPVMAVARRWSDAKRKGMTLAFIDTGSALGVIATSAAIPALVVATDWMAGWMTLGIAGLAVAAFDLLFLRHGPDGGRAPLPKVAEAEAAPRPALVSALGDSRFWLIGLAYLLTGFSILIPFTFLSTYAVEEMAFPFQSAAALLTVVGVCAIVGKLVLGPLSDRIRRIRVMMICAALIMAGTLGMAAGRGHAWLYVFTGVFGLGYGAAWSMYAAAASDYFPGEMTGGIVGMWTTLLGVGSIVSPVAAGWIADRTGTLAWSLVLASAGGAVSLLLLVPVWRADPRVAIG
jgi:MFS family permease